MLDIFDKIINASFILYILFPFIVSLVLYFAKFKNSMIYRLIAKIFCIVNFVVSSILLVTGFEYCVNIKNLVFNISQQTTLYLFIVALYFLLNVFISKSFVYKLKRFFYSIYLILLGLINVFVYCDNVLFSLIIIFSMFLSQYFLNVIFIKNKEFKKGATRQLITDFLICLTALIMITFDFSRYFIINHIDLLYSTMNDNMCNISEISQKIAFVGFLILFFRLYGLYPFKNSTNIIEKNNNFAIMVCKFNMILAGSFYLLKIHDNFDFLFNKYQTYILLYILLNSFASVFLTYRKNNVLEILFLLFDSIIPLNICVLFFLSDNLLNIYFNYIISVLFSFMLAIYIFLIAERRFKTLDLNKISIKNAQYRSNQMAVLFSLINISGVPFFGVGFSILNIILYLLQSESGSLVLNYSLYLMVILLFLIALVVYNLIYRILIEQNKPINIVFNTAYHQKVVLYMIAFVVILSVFFGLNNIN